MKRRLRLTASLLIATLFASSRARAQTPTQQAEAEALFTAAREDMSHGRHAEACPMLERSFALDPAPGTLLNLARCYEENGKTASAWATYQRAAAVSRQEGRRDWEDLAREKEAELKDKVPRLIVVVEGKSAERFAVARDGYDVAPPSWGIPVPVDPGKHVIAATAAGRLPWTTEVILLAGTTERVIVPELAYDPATDASRDRLAARSRAQRLTAYGAFGASAAGVALGTAFGIVAVTKAGQSRNACPGGDGTRCDDGAREANDSARRAATVSTVSFVAAGVLAIGAVVLLVTAKAAPPNGNARVVPFPFGSSDGGSVVSTF